MLLKAFYSLETILLLRRVDIWSSQLILDTVTSRIEAEKAVESLREGTFLKNSLSVAIFGTVGILESESCPPPHFILKQKATASGETFFEIEKAETFLEKHLVNATSYRSPS